MPCITTCAKCGKLYEESSDENANRPDRMCPPCWRGFAAWLAQYATRRDADEFSKERKK